jgi:hypothetical protein
MKNKYFLVSALLIIIYSHLAIAQDASSLPDINKLIKADFPQCRLLQLKDLDHDLHQYFIAHHRSAQPGYINADFDGNGKEDYAVLLLCNDKKKQSIRFVVFMANKNNSYSYIKIENWSDELSLKNLYLESTKPGKIKDSESGRTITTKNACFSLNLFEAASQVYYWKNGKFHYVQISD